jgi:gluconolactonase
MSLYPPPQIVEAEVWSRLPDSLRIRGRVSSWSASNKPGEAVDSFLEGPSFDRHGNLYLVDIPYGRILRVSPDRHWSVVHEYDGWPNGLKIHRDGRLFIADYKRGILTMDPQGGEPQVLVDHRYSESFHGCNDLVFARNGDLYFTDQGQSGLHQPDGRVYRYSAAGRLECLISNAPSPNGLVLNASERILYVAMTRGNSVWRLPIMLDGGVSKVGCFVQLSGGLGGPDGMAMDVEDRLFVAHAGNACVWCFDRLGAPVYRIVTREGLSTTNVAFGGEGNRSLFITESTSGSVLRARLELPGAAMYSHG